jgi:hypothetical protein
MKIVTDEKLIKGKKRLAMIVWGLSLATLAVGLFIGFQSGTSTFSTVIMLISLLIGATLYFINRNFMDTWMREPGFEVIVARVLKGLGDRYSLYNYIAGSTHLLAGPNGLWLILPYDLKGTISYDAAKDKWDYDSKKNFVSQLFSNEVFSNPKTEAAKALKAWNEFLSKKTDIKGLPEPQPIIVFANNDLKLASQDTPYPAVSGEKIKDVIRKKPQLAPDQVEKIDQLQTALEGHTAKK